jgi:hypothetical protein
MPEASILVGILIGMFTVLRSTPMPTGPIFTTGMYTKMI